MIRSILYATDLGIYAPVGTAFQQSVWKELLTIPYGTISHYSIIANAQTMAVDIARLENYRIEQVQLFDMFPHTAHYEVLTLLVRQDR